MDRNKPRRMSLQQAQKFHRLMKVISQLDKEEIESLLPFINTSGVKVLSQCTYNAICCERVDDEWRQKLKTIFSKEDEQELIRDIADPAVPLDAKKRHIIQFGGGFGIIAAALIPALVNLISGYTKPKSSKKARKKNTEAK